MPKTRTKTRRISGSQIVINGLLVILVLAWTIPTIGLFISSFRTRFDIQTSGWWTVFPHQEWETVATFPVPEGINRSGVMIIEGAQGTFEQFREGIETPDGKRLIWVGNRRTGVIQIQEQRWTRTPTSRLTTISRCSAERRSRCRTPDGTTETVQGDNFIGSFLNSLTVTIPATLIPILIAAFAAYGFAWMRFPGRRSLSSWSSRCSLSRCRSRSCRSCATTPNSG